jgi:hypothetical protein
MLTGRTPHLGNVHHAVLVAICTRDAPDVRLLAPQVSAELAGVIAQALSRERERRFESAQSFLAELAPFSSLHAGPRYPLTPTTRVSAPSLNTTNGAGLEPAAPKRTRSGKVVALGLVLLLLVAGLSIAAVNKRLKSERERERAALWQKVRVAPRPLASATSAPPGVAPPIATATASAGREILATEPSVTDTASRRSPNNRVNRAARRQAATQSGELQLKTTMP